MSEKNEDRRCLTCGKKLLDEKLPICLRCRLQGRNTTAKVGEAAGGLAVAALSIISIANNNNNGGGTPEA